MDNTTSMDHVEFTARRSLPMMALRGLTVFPGMMLTFEVERSMSIAALNMAMSDDQIIYLVPQKDIATDIPTPDDVYGVGTVCRIKQMMKQPGTKTIRVMAEGIERGRTLAVRTDTPCFVAEVEPLPDVAERKTARTEALIRHCCNLFDAYVTASGNMAPEAVISVLGSTNAAFVSNFISQHVFLRPEEKQELLEETRPSRRLSKLSKMLLHETSVLGLQHQLEEAAQDRLNQTQQEYLLREQMKIIQAELGESDDPDSESADYREKILALHLPEDSEQRLLKEVDRLKKQPFGSSEASAKSSCARWTFSPSSPTAAPRRPSSATIWTFASSCRGTRARKKRSMCAPRARCLTKSTSGLRRSRTGSQSIWPCASSRPMSRAACCASSALRAPARRASP